MRNVSLTKQPNSPKHNLPIIKCECGHEILLLPDLKIMAQAIEKHAQEHKTKNALTNEETYRIRDTLIAKTFNLAANHYKP